MPIFDLNRIEPLRLRVAVVIPTFNRAHLLQRALDSVLAQTSKVSEIIVVDDGSTDDTERLVSKYIRSHDNFRYIKQENKGVSAARNSGILASDSSWIAFLDSDDEWLPNKIELQSELIFEHRHLRVLHGNERWVRNGKFVNQMKKHLKSGGRIYQNCLERCLISPSAVMIHKEVFNKVGRFREDFPVCEDYDLWLKITSEYEVGFVEEPVITKYGGHADQLSRRFVAMDHWRIVSMLSMLDQGQLSNVERKATVEMIKYKSSILRQGYLKHGRHKEIKELDAQTETVN